MTRNKTDKPSSRKGSRPITQQKAQSPRRRVLWIAGGVALALLVVLAGVSLMNSRGGRPAAEPGVRVADLVGQPVDRRTLGDPNAPVVIQAYEDFQCPHCQRFNASLEDTIRNDLVAPGLARFEFLSRFVIGPDSITAASAAECAADQGLFWEYHDHLMAALERNPRFVHASNLKQLASELGLDRATFDVCLDTREHYEALLREDADARNRGVNSTPTIFINGQLYQGSFDPAEFKAAVEAAAGTG